MTETGVQADAVVIRPYPLHDVRDAWEWLQEFPQNNFDDFGPKSRTEFREELIERSRRGEKIWIAYVNHEPAGIIGYAPMNTYCGSFHGICFAKKWHGKGVAKAAVSKVIDEIFAGGQQKISASFFADNERVAYFLYQLGFKYEGTLLAQTLRGGKPVDMVMTALFKEEV
jgi:RimJ/RimL family protein N-acetyltransferase